MKITLVIFLVDFIRKYGYDNRVSFSKDFQRVCDQGVRSLAVMQETKHDGGYYTGPSERLSSERKPLSGGIHLLQAIAKEQIIFSHVRFLFCLISFPR